MKNKSKKTKKPLILTIIGLFLILSGFMLYSPDIPQEILKGKYALAPSKFLKLDGMEVHYRVEGSGPALVLIHGTSSSLHTWDGWATALKDSFTIIRMDIPAFGLTGAHPEDKYSIEDYVSFIDRFSKALQLDSFALAGNSLGGRIAWNYALAHPKKVKKLILLDSSGVPHESAPSLIFKLATNPVLKHIIKYVTPRFLVKSSLEEVYFDDTKISEELIDRYHDIAKGAGTREAFIKEVNQNTNADITSLDKITCPTLLLWGKHDIWIPVSDAQIFKEKIEHSQLIIYDNAGHIPMEEIPEITALDARVFLSKGL